MKRRQKQNEQPIDCEQCVWRGAYVITFFDEGGEEQRKVSKRPNKYEQAGGENKRGRHNFMHTYRGLCLSILCVCVLCGGEVEESVFEVEVKNKAISIFLATQN